MISDGNFYSYTKFNIKKISVFRDVRVHKNISHQWRIYGEEGDMWITIFFYKLFSFPRKYKNNMIFSGREVGVVEEVCS